MGELEKAASIQNSDDIPELVASSFNAALDRALFPEESSATSGPKTSEISIPNPGGISAELGSIRSALAEHRTRTEGSLSELTNRLSIFDSFQHSTGELTESRRLGNGGFFVVKCGVSYGAVQIELDIKPAQSGYLGFGKTPIIMRATLYVEGAPLLADPITISAPGQLYCGRDELRGWLSSAPTQWSERSIVERASAYLRNIVDSAVEAIQRINADLPIADVRPSFEIELVSRCAQLLNTPSLLRAYVAERERQRIDPELKEIGVALSKKSEELSRQLDTLAQRLGALKDKVMSEPSISEAIHRFAGEFAIERDRLQQTVKQEISGGLTHEFDLYLAERENRQKRAKDQGLLLALSAIALKHYPTAYVDRGLIAEIASSVAQGYPRSRLSHDEYCQVFEAIARASSPTAFTDRNDAKELALFAAEVAAEAGESLTPAAVPEFVKFLGDASKHFRLTYVDLLKIRDHFFPKKASSHAPQ